MDTPDATAAQRGPEPTHTATCEQCRNPFTRRRSGGSPQRFCSEPCRRAYNATHRKRAQRAAQRAEKPDPAPSPTAEDAPYDPFNDEDAVLIREHSRIAVYLNQFNDVVIASENWPDGEAFIRIAPEYLGALIGRLEQLRQQT